MSSRGKWKNGARAAISLTLDNMGEAADLNRGLWPQSQPIGQHYSVIQVLPKILTLLARYNISITYFVEAWNFTQYPDSIANLANSGHEISWHAWQHEAWGKLSQDAEMANFERSFEAKEKFVAEWRVDRKGLYRGFRPPGGVINADVTLKECRARAIEYISPAAEHAAVVDISGEEGKMVILPFRWRTVDAYYYMEAFRDLRQLKGEERKDAMEEETLVQRYIAEVDRAIECGEFVSFLFHPFLTDSVPRLRAMEKVVEYLARKRDEGLIWLARCDDICEYVREHPGVVGSDPEWDTTTWR